MALVANEKNAAKTKCLGLISVCFWLDFTIQFLVLWVCKNRALLSCVVGFSASETVKVSSVTLFVQKSFLVLLVRFLRRCKFQVVSLSSRFETTPDLSASKHIKFVVCKV